MKNLNRRSKRHVSVSPTIVRVRELPPVEIGYDVRNIQDLSVYHVERVPIPTDEEISELIARAKQHMQDMKIYLPLVADGLVRQNVGARRL